jgi:hypothetical protein
MRICRKRNTPQYSWLLAAMSLGCSVPVMAQQSTLPVKQVFGVNLVQNSGFETDATPWQIAEKTATITRDFAHGGANSLFYTNTDTARYNVFTQYVVAQPGQLLSFRAQIKGQEIAGKDAAREDPSQGAGIYAESYDATGKYIGGSYPPGLRGTFDWTQVQGEYTVPANAATTQVGLYFSKSITGSAWFDDVEVNLASFKSFLQFPNYRGMVKQGDKTPWKFLVHMTAQPTWKDASVKLDHVLQDETGKIIFDKSTTINVTEKNVDVMLSAPTGLTPGKYTLKQTIIDPNGEVAQKSQHFVQVVPEMPKTYIDAEGFTVVDGKRFFPLGLYLGPTEEEHLKRISDGGFNTILTYGYGREENPEAYLQRAQQHNLKVIYNVAGSTPDVLEVAGETIKKLKSNPALLAWYINDELGPEWKPELQRRYDQAAQLGPDQMVFQVLYQVEALDKYFGLTDVLGTDPYWVGKNADLTTTTDYTRKAIAATHGIEGVWTVPQIFDWSVYGAENKPHLPTLDEMRNQSYQSIINGATGLIFYSYFDLWFADHKRVEDKAIFEKRWPDVAAMTLEIKVITPAILHGKKVALALPAEKKVEVGAWEHEGQLLILLANPYYQEEKVTMAIPKGWKVAQVQQGAVKSSTANGEITFTLPAIGSGVFRLVKN